MVCGKWYYVYGVLLIKMAAIIIVNNAPCLL